LRLAGRLPMACVTDGPLASQRAKAAALGLGRWFAPLLFTAELGDGFGKPDPRSFQQVAAALGAGGPTLAYVADNPAKDFAAPRALGWHTVRVRRPLSLHEHVESGPDVDVETATLAELEAVLGVTA
jgi:putative hydrolase of the HAD superfamily